MKQSEPDGPGHAEAHPKRRQVGAHSDVQDAHAKTEPIRQERGTREVLR